MYKRQFPDGTTIEFVNTEKTSSTDLYERLARYCDEQVSKAILGQTLTSDSGGGSYAQSKTHNDVRHDLTVADCKALAATPVSYTHLPAPSATPASRRSSPATITRNSPGSTASPRDGFGAFAALGKRKGRSGSSTTWKTPGTNTRTRGLVILRSASYIKFHKTTLK